MVELKDALIDTPHRLGELAKHPLHVLAFGRKPAFPRPFERRFDISVPQKPERSVDSFSSGRAERGEHGGIDEQIQKERVARELGEFGPCKELPCLLVQVLVTQEFCEPSVAERL